MIVPAWLRSYRREQVLHDAVAGVVVTVLLVPQALAYAMLAGLPPHLGLYASILPLVAYALLGSSMTLAVGPVAVASVMTASALAPLATPGSPEYIALAVLLALLGGVQLVILGVLRMGFLANLLSHPVTSGFVTGAAILIALGQLRPLLGIDSPGGSAPSLVWGLMAAWDTLHLPTALVGLVSLALLIAGRRWAARGLGRVGLRKEQAQTLARLAPMGVVLAAVGLVSLAQLDTRFDIAVVGDIPRGFAVSPMTWPGLDLVAALVLPAFVIALVGYVESVSIAQSFANRRGERIDLNAELKALGAANLASAFSGAFPVTGGFARSSVNFDAGARTPMAGLFAAGLIALVLLGLTGLFERLPLAVLAATILVAIVSLMDWVTPRHAWRFDRADGLAWLSTTLGVVLVGVETGIAIGIGWSVGIFLWRVSRPHIAVLGQIPGTEHFRNIDRHAVAQLPELLLIRVDENLLFANITSVLDRIQTELAARPDTRHLVLVMSSVSHIDLTAGEALLKLQTDLADRGVGLYLTNVKGPVLDRLEKSGWLSRLAHPPFLSTHAAVQALAHREPGAPRPSEDTVSS